MSETPNNTVGAQRHLSVWDAVSIIVGIVVGAGIYETAPLVFSTSAHPSVAIAAWALGGALSLIGALCYAELASAYPRVGGDYVYLSRAFGTWLGFLFGWAQLSVIFTGSIAMMAFIFADYAVALWGLETDFTVGLAILPVVVLTLANLVVRLGTRTQNFFTAAKVLGLLLVFVAGAMAAFSSEVAGPAPLSPATGADFQAGAFGLAMVFVLYTYGGWNDAAFVASELKDHGKIPLTLILGTLAIVVIYCLINLAYLGGLGFEAAKGSKAIAADLLQKAFGTGGAAIMALLVMISALGAVNGLILTGSRLYPAMGTDHKVFAWLSRWNPRLGTPLISLLAQAAVTVGLLLLVGTTAGRVLIASAAVALGLAAPVWEGHGGFDTLLRCTAPVFWAFFFLTGVSVFILRIKEPKVPRPFRVPLYPLTPLLFCATSAYMFYRSVLYAGGLTLVGFALLAAGVPLYLRGKTLSRKTTTVTQPPNEGANGGFYEPETESIPA